MKEVNSNAYWDGRFQNDWETNEGPAQSRFFCALVLDALPAWVIRFIRDEQLSVLDWGCAQGDGTFTLTEHIPPGQISGMDFSSVAIKQAREKYPSLEFIQADLLSTKAPALPVDAWDVLFCSNVLEHFSTPFDVLDSICCYAKKIIIIAIPFCEYDRIPEHEYTFTPQNIPLELTNGFKLMWAKVVDCGSLPQTHWGGNQIFLVYTLSGVARHLQLNMANGTIRDDVPYLQVNEIKIKKDALLDLIIANDEFTEIKNSILWRFISVFRKIAQMINSTTSFIIKQLHCVYKPIHFFRKSVRALNAKNLIRFLQSVDENGISTTVFKIKKLILKKLNGEDSVIPLVAEEKISIVDIIKKNNTAGKQVVVYGPTIEFTYSMTQRPQHLSKALSQEGCFVVYVEPGCEDNYLKVTDDFCTVKTTDIEYSYANLKGAIVIFPQGSSFSKHHAALLSIAKNNFFIFEYLDHFSEKISGYNGVCTMAHTFMFAIQNKKYFNFLATAKILQNDLSQMMQEKEILLNPNAVDINLFKRDDSGSVPEKIKRIVAEKKPIIGYFGAMAPWLAYAEINVLMELRQDCNFIFIGPDYAHGAKALNTSLNNCHWINKVENKLLPSYAQHFSIAWIPFESGEIAYATSPLKLFEYCALGLGVIANADMRECAQYKPVRLAKTVEQYSHAIDELLEVSDSSAFREEMLSIARENTWAKRAAEILNFAKRHFEPYMVGSSTRDVEISFLDSPS